MRRDVAPRAIGPGLGPGRGGHAQRFGQRCVDRALDVTRKRADVWAKVGQVRELEGHAAQARAAFRRALAIDPANADAKQGLEQVGQ